MSMTKSRQKVYWERRDALERAKREAMRPMLEAMEQREERFRVTLAIKREVERWRAYPADPWMIWLGPEEYDRWRSEIADQFGLEDRWDGVPIIRVEGPGIDVLRVPVEPDDVTDFR